MERKNEAFKFEIVNQLGVISTTDSGWNLELNRVSWGGREPKYDIRSWSPDHGKCRKGLTLTEEQLVTLSKLLDEEVAYLKQG